MTRPLTYEAALESVVVKALATHHTASARLVRYAIEEFLRTACDAAERAGEFRAPELGVLYRHRAKSRRIRNPVTRELMTLPPRWALKLRAAKHRKGWGR